MLLTAQEMVTMERLMAQNVLDHQKAMRPGKVSGSGEYEDLKSALFETLAEHLPAAVFGGIL
ncbi:hypothetical protein T03_17139 [Trichinella britovi]|uniref:Uncharacterized protein n=1 Tax=Trichinella britovi TaxID=45882 RepID=A0A0V1D4N6_TRIBR|nr:hypothetical protein T09_9693 [Trichinella sp. T9]KRY56528.1 hypothetical protein T03_17139 [Trichinella britovi]KRZ90765.1 hypothetical protein T08_10490 [Trichinella sp. T8]